MLIETRTTLRHFHWDDLEQCVEVINASQRALGNPFDFTVDDLRADMDEPGYDAERDGFVVATESGRIIAFSDIAAIQDTGRVYMRAFVHPDYLRQGLGRQLVHATDAHALQITQDVAADKPIYVQRYDIDPNVGMAALMASEGYHVVRYMYRMMTDNLPEDAPALPEGITLRPFDVERDAYAVYEAVTEAFRDHWGGDVAQPYDMWRHYTVEKPDFDPSLWLIAYDGEQIAGVCLCQSFGKSMPDLGNVKVLAVRRPWRRRGLGETLLRQAFVMFRTRGCKKVSLGVDASSKTNAVALYERAGMSVSMRRVAYRKILRGDASMIHD